MLSKNIKWTEHWYSAERNLIVIISKDTWKKLVDSSFRAYAYTETENPQSVRLIWRSLNVRRWNFWSAPTWLLEDWTSPVCLSVRQLFTQNYPKVRIRHVNFALFLFLVINVTLPDEKSNYVHRIGRVGRAERMGLAISLVSSVPEKVWYHGEWCPSRGRNCINTNLTDQGGCCTWYNEPRVSFPRYSVISIQDKTICIICKIRITYKTWLIWMNIDN